MKDENKKTKGENQEKDIVQDESEIVFEEEKTGGFGGGDSEEKIKKLREKLKICEAEKSEYLTGWQRSKADFVNLRKRDEEAKALFLNFAKEDIIVQILPVLGSFEMAFANKEAWEKAPPEWRTGVTRIYSQLLSILEANNVKRIDPKGEIFDPKYHEAVGVVPVSKEEDNNKIADVMNVGYTLFDKVIQTAKVRVGEYKGS